MIGENIRRIRKQQKLSQQTLGDMVGATRQTISCWERGITKPSRFSIMRIVAALGCDESEIKD
jgi:transcriptional regulator with XRE-family HTH domain